MKKTFLILSFLFVFKGLNGQDLRSFDSLLDSKTKDIDSEIAALSNKIETERNINDKTFNSISTQISAASLTLTLMGIAFAIVAIGVGGYVTYVERKITKIGIENRELLLNNQRIKKDVEELNRLIQSDIKGLFSKLKRQETIDLLDRLHNVPKDISNICSLLLARELYNEDFDKLKQAYSKLNLLDISYKSSYKLLFFQHFLTNALKDDDLRKDIIEYIPNGIRAAFENDILKSTHDFAVAVIDKGLNNFKEEVNKYFVGLNSSQHKNYTPVYVTLFDSLKTRQNRFDFLNLIDTTKDTRIAKIGFGKLLVNEYGNLQTSESESLAIQGIKELELQILKEEEEEAKVKLEFERSKREEVKRRLEERNRQ